MLREGFALSGSNYWGTVNSNFSIDCTIHAPISPFKSAGFKLISTPSNNGVYSAGATLDLSIENLAYGDTPQWVEWFFDGSPMSSSAFSSAVLMTAGKHIIKAVLHYPDGSTEEIEQTISAQ